MPGAVVGQAVGGEEDPLQGREDGRWRTFADTRTSEAGRYRATIHPDGDSIRWRFDAGVAHLFTADEIAQMTIPVGIGATGQAVAYSDFVNQVEEGNVQSAIISAGRA